MLHAQFEGALYFASVYAACVVCSSARSIRRARTIRRNTVCNVVGNLKKPRRLSWPLQSKERNKKVHAVKALSQDSLYVKVSEHFMSLVLFSVKLQ